MEDKAIEAIAKYIYEEEMFPMKWDEVSPVDREIATEKSKQLLTSLGYVKLADEQKLPKVQVQFTGVINYKQIGVKAQQDMLKVDSEGCKWVRVRVK
jgi:hypothetical protein